MSPALVQFIKYAMCGGVATGVDMLVFYLLSWLVLPALRDNDPVVRLLRLRVRPVDERVRARRFVINTVATFMVSNLAAYLLNIHWVFEPGRHPWYIEIGLFYAVSGISVALGTGLGWAMIRWLHFSTTASYAGKLVASLMINYVCRKFVIFRG